MAKVIILAIEDEPDIRELISYNLGREGWTVVTAETAERGMALIAQANPDIILLDVMLPGIDGFQALKKLKADPKTKNIPVILTTAKGEDSDIVAGLELGADDYVTKPFSPKVLVARIRKCLRSSMSGSEDTADECPVSVDGLSIDPRRHEAFSGSRKLDLSATEFSLLELFLRNPGWVFSRSQIIEAVRGSDYPVTDRAVDVQILGLRKKLAEEEDVIETVRGVGYRMKG